MWALAISHTLPGGHGAGHRRQLPAADRVRTCRAAPPPSVWPPRASARPSCSTSSSGSRCSSPSRCRATTRSTGSRPSSGVLLLAIFAAVVFLLTRGEKQAGVFVKKVADRLPFVRAETVTSLVQKVADRMKILFTSSRPAGPGRHLGGGQLAARLPPRCGSSCLAFGAHVSPIDVLVAYGLANILAVIPLTPSGLGRRRADRRRRAEGLRRARGRGRRRRPQLAPGQLLAPHPLRRLRLPVAALRPRPRATRARRAKAAHLLVGLSPTASRALDRGAARPPGPDAARHAGWRPRW